MTFACLEERISADNPIRFIDAFVENIDLKALGFEVQTLRNQRAYLWNDQAAMGLQPHQLNGIGKSKRRTQPDYVSLQHQTQHQYTRRSRTYCQTPKMELTL